MEWHNLRCYSHRRQAPKNMHCDSPVPDTAAPSALGRRHMTAKAPPLHRDLLSKPKQRPCAKKQFGNTYSEVLPKIQENAKTTQMECLSAEHSVELNYNESRSLNMREHVSESSATSLKASLHLTSASKESPQNSEATSEMTLPSGVSDFLLDCLDVDATVGPDTESSDSFSTSYSSPEIFRDGSGLEENVSPEECLGCKNSTLLDTSKATNIDKMPQLSTLSKIFEASGGDQDECFMSESPSKRKLHSELTKASTVVAGKQVCKILSAKEKTPQSQSSAVLLLPQKQQKQHKEKRSRNMKCSKKVQFRSTIFSSPVALRSNGKNTSATPHGAATGTLASTEPVADMETGLRAMISRKNTALLTSTAVLQPEDLECLRNPPEICSIITASPDFTPPKVLKHPLNKKILFPSSGVTEDIITSPKNWVYNHDRCIGLQNMTKDTCIKMGSKQEVDLVETP